MGKTGKILKVAVYVLGTGVALTGLIIGASWHNARKIVQQRDDEYRKLPEQHPGDYGMDYETLDLQTADGVCLHAWFIPGSNGAAAILQHGYKMNRAEMLPQAKILNRHGFGILLIELRNHGYSQGDKITFGFEEMYDIRAGLDYLGCRKDVQPDKIVMAGNSMGAAITILAAARYPEIRAVVADCPFADLTGQVRRGVRKFAPMAILAVPLAGLIRKFAERIVGFKTAQISPLQEVAKISPRPLLLIQGSADEVVGAHNGETLFAAAGEPKELWEVPDCGHCYAIKLYPDEYERRVVQFFQKALGLAANG